MNTFSTVKTIALLASFATVLPAQAGESMRADDEHYITTDRYTKVDTQPRNDQYSPLDTLISAAFGEEIKTVGQAIQNVLEGSSYTWAPPANGKKEDALLTTIELPQVNREFGPTSLRSALSALAGKAWELKTDDTLRVIWFEPRKKSNGLFTRKQ